MDEELNKLKMQRLELLEHGEGLPTTSDDQKIDNGSCENLGNDSQVQFVGRASRSAPNVVMNFMTKVYKKQAEDERFLVHVQDLSRSQWGSTDDPACPRAGISDHEA